MEAGKVIIGVDLNAKNFEAQIKKAESELELLEASADESSIPEKFRRSAEETEKLNAEIEKAKNKLVSLRAQQEKTTKSSKEYNLNIGKSVKSLGRMLLAVFSIRTAYGMISSAVSTLSQYNEEMANNISNIKYSIASALEKPITGLINLVYTLMQYVNYLSNAWFGVSVFADKAAKSTTKAAKATKSLAGFDEVNKVSDSSSSGSSGYTPQGISPLGEGETPEWLEWIAQNKDLVIGFFATLLLIFGAIQLLEFASTLEEISLALAPIMSFITNPIFLGIVALIGGLALAIYGVIQYLNDPTWENFQIILGGIVLIVTAIGILFGGIPAIIALVVGAVVALGLAIYKNWDKIKEWLGKIASWINEKIITPIKNGASKFFTWIGNKLTEFKNTFKNIMNVVWSIAKVPINFIIGGLNTLISGIDKISFDVPDWVPIIGGQKWGFNIPQIPKLAKGGIISNPGRGVNLGSAIGGENGREAVFPLTDSQQMQALGETIAKYVKIDNIVDVSIDSRKIKRIMQNSDNRSMIANNG